MRTTALRAAASALLMLLGAQAWAGIGTVERAQGTVSVDLQQGGNKALAVGDAVEESQTLRTGANSEAVIRFNDNALMIVRPNTQVKLATYRYRENDSSSSSLIQLAKGGMRFVTGLMGKLNRESVKVASPVVTIGIRGTDFDTVFLEERADGLEAGSYTCVTEGATYMSNDSGKQVEIGAGQAGFVTSADFIARGLAAASSMGVIQPPPGLFRSGTFDGQMQDLKQEGLRRLQGSINDSLPAELRNVVPGAGAMVSGAGDMLKGMFGRKKDAAAAASACGH